MENKQSKGEKTEPGRIASAVRGELGELDGQAELGDGQAASVVVSGDTTRPGKEELPPQLCRSVQFGRHYIRQYTRLDKAKQNRALGEKIFSREIPGSNGKRTFCCASYDKFWRKYQTLTIRNYYEVLEDSPVKLYFDLGKDFIYCLLIFYLSYLWKLFR